MRVLVAIVLIALFVPVPYFAGNPSATPPFFAESTAGLPNSIWYLIALSVVFLVITWLIAAAGVANAPTERK